MLVKRSRWVGVGIQRGKGGDASPKCTRKRGIRTVTLVEGCVINSLQLGQGHTVHLGHCDFGWDDRGGW